MLDILQREVVVTAADLDNQVPAVVMGHKVISTAAVRCQEAQAVVVVVGVQAELQTEVLGRHLLVIQVK